MCDFVRFVVAKCDFVFANRKGENVENVNFAVFVAPNFVFWKVPVCMGFFPK